MYSEVLKQAGHQSDDEEDEDDEEVEGVSEREGLWLAAEDEDGRDEDGGGERVRERAGGGASFLRRLDLRPMVGDRGQEASKLVELIWSTNKLRDPKQRVTCRCRSHPGLNTPSISFTLVPNTSPRLSLAPGDCSRLVRGAMLRFSRSSHAATSHRSRCRLFAVSPTYPFSSPFSNRVIPLGP